MPDSPRSLPRVGAHSTAAGTASSPSANLPVEPVSRLRRAGFLAFAGGLPLVLTGCYIVPVGVPRGGRRGPEGPEGDDDWIGQAPPPLRAEEIPVAPVPTYLWIGGYWTWRVNRYVWVGGRWALPPRGHVWVPHRWDRGPRGWRARPGHWARR
jgi:hypothetical protein